MSHGIGQSSQDLTHGTPTDLYPSVVALVDSRLPCDANGAHAWCTGVLVAPRVVLTAAHCVSGRSPSSIEVFFGTNVDTHAAYGAFVGVSQIAYDTAYNPATPAGNDVALLRLSKDVSAFASPIPHDAIAPTDTNKKALVVGFGQDSPTSDSGLKREGAVILLQVAESTIEAGPAPSLTCAGDSGAPLLIDRGAGPALVGITSYGDKDCSVHSVFARTDLRWSEFVESFAATQAPSLPVVLPNSGACGTTCSDNSQCGPGRSCNVQGSESGKPPQYLCGLSGLPEGSYGNTCTHNADCNGEACVAVQSGEQRSCFCYLPCDPATRCDSSLSILPDLIGPACTESTSQSDSAGCQLTDGTVQFSVAYEYLAVVLLISALRPRFRRNTR